MYKEVAQFACLSNVLPPVASPAPNQVSPTSCKPKAFQSWAPWTAVHLQMDREGVQWGGGEVGMFLDQCTSIQWFPQRGRGCSPLYRGPIFFDTFENRRQLICGYGNSVLMSELDCPISSSNDNVWRAAWTQAACLCCDTLSIAVAALCMSAQHGLLQTRVHGCWSDDVIKLSMPTVKQRQLSDVTCGD